MAKSLGIIIVLIGLILPLIGFTQQVISCCKLVRTIKYEDVTYNSGIWVSESATTKTDECAPGAPVITTTCPTTGTATTSCITADWGTLCLINVVARVTNWVTYISLAVVAVMVIVGALTLTTAAGDPEKVKSGKNYILFAVVGLIIAILSRAIPAVAARIVGAL
jgi:hypothetical protein